MKGLNRKMTLLTNFNMVMLVAPLRKLYGAKIVAERTKKEVPEY